MSGGCEHTGTVQCQELTRQKAIQEFHPQNHLQWSKYGFIQHNLDQVWCYEPQPFGWLLVFNVSEKVIPFKKLWGLLWVKLLQMLQSCLLSCLQGTHDLINQMPKVTVSSAAKNPGRRKRQTIRSGLAMFPSGPQMQSRTSNLQVSLRAASLHPLHARGLTRHREASGKTWGKV